MSRRRMRGAVRRSGIGWVSLLMFLGLLEGAAAQAIRSVEAESVLGRPLYAKERTAGTETSWTEVDEARAALAAAQNDDELRAAVLRLGRALDAVWSYREAVSVYSAGLSSLREDGELFLRRGVSLLRLREFDRAFDDLRRAARELPRSFEANYRFGLVEFLRGDYRKASNTFQAALLNATTDDERVAAIYWAYAAARRAGRRDDSEEILRQIPDEVTLQESDDYHQLLQMTLGHVGEYAVYNLDTPAAQRSTTRGFGVANWHLDTGGEDRAREYLSAVAGSADWPAIGVIAAEVDLQRLRR